MQEGMRRQSRELSKVFTHNCYRWRFKCPLIFGFSAFMLENGKKSPPPSNNFIRAFRYITPCENSSSRPFSSVAHLYLLISQAPSKLQEGASWSSNHICRGLLELQAYNHSQNLTYEEDTASFTQIQILIQPPKVYAKYFIWNEAQFSSWI